MRCLPYRLRPVVPSPALPFVLLVSLLSFSSFGARAAIRYVDDDSISPAPTGGSWETAFRSVLDAVGAAQPGDEVWVAAGTYTGRVTLRNGVDLYGGFQGNEVDRAQRDWQRHETILDGGKVGTIVYGTSGVRARVDGFTLRNGTTEIASSSRGGGVYLYGSVVTLVNDAFEGNRALYGGGVFCTGGTLVVEDCVFQENDAFTGGAIQIQDGGRATIRRNRVVGNGRHGSETSGSPLGGGICGKDSTIEITQNHFVANSALTSTSGSTVSGEGGGIYIAGGTGVRISGNLIAGNAAGSSGGVYLSSTGAVFSGNVLTGNAAGSAAALLVRGDAQVVGNTIVDNTAAAGSTVQLAYGQATLVNNVIAFNSGGFAVSTGTSATLRSNDFFGNRVSDLAGISGVIGANGNRSEDPQFASLSQGNLHLQPTSPLIDAGDPATIQDASDMDGQPRVQGTAVDIGADESDGTRWPATPRVIRVRPDGDDALDGASWGSAMRSVRAALESLEGAGGEVWVARGKYSAPLRPGPFVSLYGGFAGDEAVRDARDPVANPTILDAGWRGSVVSIRGTSFGALDGFVIQNGSAPWGGGVSALWTPVTVSRNVIGGNQATRGGGVFALQGDFRLLTNRIEANQASAFEVFGPARVANNIVVDNGYASARADVLDSPSAKSVITDGPVTVVNNTFARNDGLSFLNANQKTVVANNIFAFTRYFVTTSGSPSFAFRNNALYNPGLLLLRVPAGVGVNGNIGLDPLLSDLESGNTHIQPSSPCVDAGDNAYVDAGETDTNGQPRVQGGRVDIGADESDGTEWALRRAVVRVSPNGFDANDGASWDDAKRTVQAAIDALDRPFSPGGSGGEVWVAGGTYGERITLGPRTRVYGGFRGIETRREERDWNALTTVLDAGSVADGGGPVALAPVLAVRSVLDGFTVRHGRAERGGGVSWAASEGLVSHNVVTDNTAYQTGLPPFSAYEATSGLGGGIFAGSPSLVVENNLIRNNTAAVGGGVATNTYASIRNNTIVENTAKNGGGVALAPGFGTLVNSIVAFNSTGIYIGNYHSYTMRTNCAFGNTNGNFENVNYPLLRGSNMTEDPRFVDRAGGDFRLQASSPCIDAGDTAYAQPDGVDLYGQPRVRFVRVDIGAHESPAERVYLGLDRVYVTLGGNDANDGATWATAKRTVSAGIAAARYGGEVWVAEGTYVQREIRLHDGVGLYGGFRGTETTREPRTMGLTALEPPSSSSDALLIAPLTVSNAAIVDGFVLRYASPTLLGDGGSPTIQNNVIDVFDRGIRCEPGSSPRFLGNVFRYVSTGSESLPPGYPAIECKDGAPVFIGNTFTRISQGVSAGNCELTFVANTFDDCGGLALSAGGGSAIVTHNTATRSGGGFRFANTRLVFTNNDVRNNQQNGLGGLSVVGGTAEIRDNVLFGNALSPTTSGQVSGAAMLLENATATVAHNTVAGHTAFNGGAVSIKGGAVAFSSNIVAHNMAGLSVEASAGSTLMLRANCFFDNGGLNVRGVPDPVGTDGNIGSDPRLASLLSGDVHIQPDSPCRDAGEDAVVAEGDTDMDGQPRIQGGRSDIGADESDGTLRSGATRVLYVRSSGSNASDGLSWATALRTVQAACDAAQRHGGAEVRVSAGTYREQVFIGSFTRLLGGYSGTAPDPDVRDPARYRTILDATMANGIPEVTVQIRTGSMLTEIDGFTVRGSRNAWYTMSPTAGGIVCKAGSNAAIRNNVIRDNEPVGLRADGPALVEVAGNTFTGNGGGAIHAGSGTLRILGNRIVANGWDRENSATIRLWSGSAVIANNVIAHNRMAREGIVHTGDATDALIANNTIVRNETGLRWTQTEQVAGAVVARKPGVRVLNNIIAWNTGGIETGTTAETRADIRSNCVFSNKAFDYDGVPDLTGLDGNIRVDPNLVSTALGRFHLQPGSPCREAGETVGVDPLWRDMDGEPRIQGPAVDIGADESDGTLWSADPAIVRVIATGDDMNDGSSWAAAKRTLTAAMEAAERVGGEVWVSTLGYSERLAMGPYVSLYGGFAGTETERDARDPESRRSLIQSGKGGSILTIRSGTAVATVDGLVLQNGYTAADTYTVGIPPTLDAPGSSIVVSHVSFGGNTGNERVALRCTDAEAVLSANRFPAMTGGIRCERVKTVVSANELISGDIQTLDGVNDVFENKLTDGSIIAAGTSRVENNRLISQTGSVGILIGDVGISAPIHATVANNLLVNRSTLGGGIGVNATSAGLIANNTVIGVHSDYGTVAGIQYNMLGPPAVNNIIVGYDYAVFGEVPELRNNVYAGVLIEPSPGTPGLTLADPRFVNAAAGDYHLLPESPCRDAGDDTVVEPGWADLDGQHRVMGTRVDIGADEFPDTPVWTMPDVLQALRVAGGLEALRPGTKVHVPGVEAPVASIGIAEAAAIAHGIWNNGAK